MIVDYHRKVMDAVGIQAQWKLFREVTLQPTVYSPLTSKLDQLVKRATVANPSRPEINTRMARAEAFQQLGPDWQDEFARLFPERSDDAIEAVFGMALWNSLASDSNTWQFSTIADNNRDGQTANIYWRKS